jgi:hypothetical protein
MARRTAMSKEPRTESSRKGPPDRNSNIRRLPGKPIDRLTRVSPGVYRNSQGKLVGSQGQSLGRRDNRPGAAIGDALGDMTNPGNRMPAGRPGQQTPPVMTNPGARTPAARPGQQALPVEMPQGWLPEWQRLQQSPGNMGEQFANQVTRPNPNFKGIVRDAAGQLAQNNMANQIGQNMGNMQMPNYGEMRTLTSQERAARGIDPRDPNTYSIMPDGQVVGTMMGWSPDMQGQNIFNATGNQAQRGRAAGNSIGDLLRRGR